MKIHPNLPRRRLGQRLFTHARALLAVSVLAALAVSPRAAAQAPTFNTLVTTFTGNPGYEHPNMAGVGDFNGDGKLDALVGTGSDQLRLMLGNGDGTFNQSYVYSPGAHNQYTIKVADLNGDGKLDAITVSNQGNLAAAVLINTGNIAGVPQFTVTNYTNPGFGTSGLRSLTVGDLNGDGKPDFVVGNANGGIRVWLNNGDGTFAGGQYYGMLPGAGGPSVGAGVIADFNGDGKADYLVTSNQNNAINIFWGNGDGTFQATPAIIPATNGMFPVVSDLNNDGKPDFLAVDIGTGKLQVYLNNGNGTFSGPTLYSTGLPNPITLAFTDMNGDGKMDVVTSDQNIGSGINNVAVLLGNGDGTFGAPNLYNGTQRALDLAVGDFNGDGKPDIGMVGFNDDTYGVLTNTTPAPVQAQLFFTDALTGPTSPNLAAFPAGKYSYTASGLQRSQSNGDTDRPVVSTALATYLASATGNFGADITVTLANSDLLFFGLGQGDTDSGYYNEPSHAFYFRVHSNWGGISAVGASVRSLGGAFLAAGANLGNYTLGSTIILRITRIGDVITMSVVGGSSTTFSLSAHQTALGLTNANTKVFFGNTTAGSTFSNLKIYPLPNDTTAPVITAPGDIVAEATNSSGAPVAFTATATDDIDGPVNVVASPASGSTFPIATTIVGLAAADKAGNTASATFKVKVQDTTPPGLIVSGNLTAEAANNNGAIVAYPAASATDAVGVTSLTYSQNSGTQFALGDTLVNVTAKDAANNTTTKSFTVAVKDTTAPALNVPASQTLEATSSSGAVATFSANATDAVTASPTITYSAPSGSTFPLGTTTVDVSAKDAANNTSTGTFTIKVQDTIAPSLTVPGNQTLEATSAAGAVATFAASATDAVGVTSLTYSAASGSPFPIGTTIVNVTAKDAVGHTTTGSFTVTVRDSTAPTITNLSTNAPTLWPPNHKMVAVSVSASASDAVGVASLKIISVTSNEPDNGLGDGDTAGDIEITGNLTVNLRAERSGTGNGRTYTITVEAKDAKGNASTRIVTVSVPKNQSGK